MSRDPFSGLTDLLEKLREVLETHKLDPKYRDGDYDEDEILKMKIRSSREAKHNHKLDGWL